MKKAILVLRERGKSAALKSLRRLGVVHADPIEGRGQSWEAASEELARLDSAIGILLSCKSKETAPALDYQAALELARKVNETAELIKSAQERIAALRKEMERIQGWGDFDPAVLAYLRENGMDLRLYEAGPKAASSMPPELPVIRVVSDKTTVRFAGFPAGPVSLPEGVAEFAPPQASLSSLGAEEKASAAEAARGEAFLAEAAKSRPHLEAARERARSGLTFETLLSGMEGEGPVAWISGWVPEKDAPGLSKAAAEHGWGLLLDDPGDDEMPPTKVESNPVVRMIAPVFDFLGTVPNYREYDISASFLAFFTVFFAMIFGDGGYGSILLGLGLFAALKAKKAGGKVPDAVRLLLLLSSATVAWGVVTGSWFGLPAEILPGFLKGLRIGWLASDNPLSGANTKQLCFILGLVHLVWARMKNIRRDIRSLKFLAQLGLLLQLLGMYFMVLNLVLDAVRFPIPNFALYLIGIGFLLNFVFASYEGNILKSILASLTNIVSVLLGVVNVFADITSYIRLWAVGLAGLAISQTVNTMAGPMLGRALLFAFGIVLIGFGHGLNLALSLLSVIVHGVRLNMLEYSGHLGMEWSGFKYEPFREGSDEEASVLERSPT
ncbi:MAG TPA: ATPase [Spirochaetia bacterium]|nr:ATPase [Spirochaetales bacterium]HRY80158.1 ATPase [Spirochaetia bacterium]